jgi:16S rRNA processing protein RimM
MPPPMVRKNLPSEGAAGPGAPGWVCVGVVTKPKGVRGEVRIKSFTAAPTDFVAYGPVHRGPDGPVVAFELRGSQRDMVTARVAGVADRNGAEALRGAKLYVPRAALPEVMEDDEYYLTDLVGLAVELVDGTAWGTVHALHDFGAGDILEVARAEGETVMLPFTRETVPVVDISGGRLVVEPPEEVAAVDEDG